VDKQVKVLSGGERNRLALAKLLLQPFNVLVMDEPTNHLDIKSKEVLKRALLNFGGTLFVVFYDRDFLQGFIDQVFEFRDHKVKPYLGDIDFYLEQRKVNDFREVEKATVKSQNSDTKGDEKSSNEMSYADQKKLKTLSNKLGSIEKRITELEEAIAAKDQELLERYEELVKTSGYMDRYQELKAELETKMEEWSSISDQIESFNA
jgi:ATP-binding cassette subfamily F protein 3